MPPESEIPKNQQSVLPEQNSANPSADFNIPQNYRDLPSDLVKELWAPQFYLDPEKTRTEREKRQQTIAQLEKKELGREESKSNAFKNIYAKFTPEQQALFPECQQEAQKLVIEYIQGQKELDLLIEERFVFEGLKNQYQEAKRERPDKPFTFQLEGEINNLININLVNRLTWEILKNKTSVNDNAKITSIKDSLGLSENEIKKEKQNGLTEEQIQQLMSGAYNKDKKNKGTEDEGNYDLLINRVDPEIGRRFDAHGIDKLGITDQLRFLVNLLNNGIDKKRNFHTAPLELGQDDPKGAQTAGGTAYHTGSFIVLTEPNKSLIDNGIKYVLVNDLYYEAIPTLQQAFPDVEFIRANQANDRLKEIVEKINTDHTN